MGKRLEQMCTELVKKNTAHLRGDDLVDKFNPFKILCLLGCHSWIEIKSSKYWEREGKYVLVSHTRECSVCDKFQELV